MFENLKKKAKRIGSQMREKMDEGWTWMKNMGWVMSVTIVLISIPIIVSNQNDKIDMMGLVASLKDKNDVVNNTNKEFEDIGFVGEEGENSLDDE